MLRKTWKERKIKKLKNKKGGKEKKNTGRSKNKDKEEKI